MSSLEDAITHYKPNKSVIELVRATKITLLVGISGAGKDTIKKELLKRSKFRDIISHTTRPPRVNAGVMEMQDVDYHFIDLQKAEEMLADEAFVEAKLVHGNVVYGTSADELRRSHDEGKIAITDVDVQGVAEYKDLSQNVVALFILPPNYSTWRERLSRRYESDEAFQAEWDKRRKSAVRELAHALEVPYYHFIINDELDRAVEIAGKIAAQTPDTFRRKDDEARIKARNLLEAIQVSL